MIEKVTEKCKVDDFKIITKESDDSIQNIILLKDNELLYLNDLEDCVHTVFALRDYQHEIKRLNDEIEKLIKDKHSLSDNVSELLRLNLDKYDTKIIMDTSEEHIVRKYENVTLDDKFIYFHEDNDLSKPCNYALNMNKIVRMETIK